MKRNLLTLFVVLMFVSFVNISKPVPDIVEPSITAPATLQFEEGTEGNALTWICADDHPHSYLLRINGTEEEYRPWNGTAAHLGYGGSGCAVHQQRVR